ncbi:E3 ubiquitin-protein ligase TRIM45-like [Asterias amurensis]|uniref:E3 ubiquitin-protein ligase TRIM45-like n=1 Tax=Asterias amurensis TaxID=7602 RepID=UPI003AB477ED
MATISTILKEISKDFLECSICFERYTNPKILSCVHSFCEHCLVQLFGKDVVKPCPVCRQETRLPTEGVGGLKTNGFLITLIEKIELKEKVAKTLAKEERSVPCDLCTENEVTHHCLNCSQNICQGCMKIHKRSKALADHTVGTLEDVREGKVTLPEVQKEYTCIKHKGEINRFYCETCHVLICHVCTVVDHCKPKHEYIDRAAASDKYKENWNEIFPTFTNQIKKLQARIGSVNTDQEEFEKKVSQTVQEVKKGADRLRDKVKAEEDRLLGEIRVLKEDRSTAFGEHIQTLTALLQRKQNTLTIARDVINVGSESDFLSLFPIINQHLTFLKSDFPPGINADFQYKHLDHTGSIIGKLNVGREWKLFREVGGNLPGLDETFWDVAALGSGKLAVTTINSRLVIFNTDDGKTIRADELRGTGPFNITSFHCGPVVVDDNGYIKKYDKDFRQAWQQFNETPNEGRNWADPLYDKKKKSTFRMFPEGDAAYQGKAHHSCICMKRDGNVVVGHSSKSGITYKRNRDRVISTSTKPLEKTPGFLATDSNDRVVVGGCDDDNQVIVIDDEGATLLTIKPTMNGQPVDYCRGICCDNSGIYVAVSNRDPVSGHIHHYDSYGKFISCIIQDLSQPTAITIWEDGQQLAVLVDKKAKVKIYQKI